MNPIRPLPRVIADVPLSNATLELLDGKVELLAWDHFEKGNDPSVEGIYTFGHPELNGSMMDKMPGLKVISNYGVGVDHINLHDAQLRGIPVGNTPEVLDGATADMGFCLLLAAARRLVEGDRFARGPGYGHHNPVRMLGREVNGASLGIIGMGRIGWQVARRAMGFDMSVRYFNRSRRIDIEQQYGVQYLPLQELLQTSDHVMLCVPLTPDTRNLIGADELRQMQPTATLINIARGAVVNTDALTQAMQEKWIYAAALDVTEPEPLPRDHPLLDMENVIISPHLGSATVQTRQQMSRLSVENLLAGLVGAPLPKRIV